MNTRASVESFQINTIVIVNRFCCLPPGLHELACLPTRAAAGGYVCVYVFQSHREQGWSEDNQCSRCPTSFPVPSLARTRDGRVEPPERLRPSCSSARVKGGHHVFGECPQRHDYSLRPLPVPGVFIDVRLFPGDAILFTASSPPCRSRVLPVLHPQGIISQIIPLFYLSCLS